MAVTEASPAPEAAAPSEVGRHSLLPPWEYGDHLAQQHGLAVEHEPAWPTPVRRWRLVARSKGRVLATFIGTEAEAKAHFFFYLHPDLRESQPRGGRRRRAA